MALCYAGIQVELREVFLGDKPSSLLAASAKGTVPVLILSDGRILDESIDIMRWALATNDPDLWWRKALAAETDALINANDFTFKAHLDHYKYWDRFPARPQVYYRAQAEKFIQELEHRLEHQRYLVAAAITLADVAIFPFVRQFAFVNKHWFDQSRYFNLRSWLQSLLELPLFLTTMGKQPVWREGDAPLFFPATPSGSGSLHEL